MTQERAQVRQVAVKAQDDGQRLDNFLLKTLPGVPKSHVYRLIRSGQVRVDGGRAKPERRLSAGEQVRVPPVKLAERNVAPRPPDAMLERLRAAILMEDEHYLVLNKPAGLASHGGTGVAYGAVEAMKFAGNHEFLALCHRLDRDTSGVLLFAKTRPAMLRAQNAFREGLAKKRYLALLIGRWQGGPKDVDAALVKSRMKGGERMVELGEDGKPAHSRFTPRHLFQAATLCDVDIFSGRMHQIRVHAAALGHPVAGDGKYGFRADNEALREFGLKRMFLHAESLQLPAAEGLAPLKLEAPLPEELERVLQQMQKAVAGRSRKTKAAGPSARRSNRRRK